MSLGTVDYDSYTVPKLKEMADDEGIDYKSNITKPELIEKLQG